MYDDWASAFRDTLHASFLDRVERTINADTQSGAFDRALRVTQLALQADPDAEQIELCLLRLYRRTGANAAAAEQYAHYATVLREQLASSRRHWSQSRPAASRPHTVLTQYFRLPTVGDVRCSPACFVAGRKTIGRAGSSRIRALGLEPSWQCYPPFVAEVEEWNLSLLSD